MRRAFLWRTNLERVAHFRLRMSRLTERMARIEVRVVQLLQRMTQNTGRMLEFTLT